MAQWGNIFVEGGKRLGRSVTMVDDGKQKSATEKAGYVDIQEHEVKVSQLTFAILGTYLSLIK